MKSIMQTDIYTQTTKNFAIEAKLTNLISGKAGKILTNDDLSTHIMSLNRSYKDPVLVRAIEEFRNGNIILIYCQDMSQSLPPFMPFVKFAKGTTKKVIVDLSYMMTERDGLYNIRQLESLYCILTVAELTLELFDPKSILPIEVITICGQMWAKMFCKVLNRQIALNINRDRYEAFNYFAIQYFCRYILETPIITANSVSESILYNGKTPLINNIEGEINSRKLDVYGSFQNFCTVMFNNEITGMRSGAIGSPTEMNFVTYLSAFMKEFDRSSLFGLAAFPYFLLMIFRINTGSRDINKRALEEIMMNPKQFAVIFKELQKNL